MEDKKSGNSNVLEAKISIALTDDMTVLSVSDGMEALLGYKPEDFLAARVSLESLIHPHDLDIADLLFSRAIQAQSGTFNIRLRKFNGRICCVKVQYKKLSTDSRNDILDLLIQDAKSLRQNLEDQPLMTNFISMMENTDDYIYFKDLNHVFTGASQTLVSLTDPTEHWTDMLGQTDYDVFPEEYADIYYRLEKQVFVGISVAHEIQETLSKDGEKGWVDNRKYPIKDNSGKIIGLFGIARDITEQKQAELALRESEENSRSMINQLIAGIVQRDLSSHISFVNDRYCEMTGYSREELLGMKWQNLTHPDDLPRSEELFKYHSSKDEPYTVDKRYLRKNGEVIWVSIGASMRHDDSRNIIGCTGIVVDITERKRAEQQLRELSAHLQTVREEEKARFAREIHDELGSTLLALRMETFCLVQKLTADEKMVHLLKRTDSMDSLLGNAMKATRRIITNLRPPLLDELGLIEAFKCYSTDFSKRTGIECRVVCTHMKDSGCEGCNDCQCKLDKILLITLYRIFQEALTNVARHSGASRVGVETRFGNDEVILSISDNGCGLQEGHAVASTSFGLLGMRERVGQLGGKIVFDSQPGKGFGVTATLPMPAAAQ